MRRATRARAEARCALLGLVAMALVGCKRSAPPPAAGATEPPRGEGAARVDDAGVAPRCTVADAATKDGAYVVGEAAPSPMGTLVGLSRARDPEATVEIVGGRAWVVARGAEMVADAPPPKPLVAGGEPLAAAIVQARGDAGVGAHLVVLARLGEQGATRVASFAARASDSLSFDAAVAEGGKRAALAWDDDSVDGGIVVAVAATDGGASGRPQVVSLPKSDAEGPRVEPRAGGGFWVAWIERRPEGDPPDARAEGPAEDRTFAWVTVAALDAGGAPQGAPRRLTSMTGHAGSFDLAPRAGGELDVFVRDDTEEREGSGGRVAHVVVRSGDPLLASDPVVVATGVGRASVDVVGDWLAFSDASDRPLLAPLGDARAFAAPPSVEEPLEGARLLAAESRARFLAASPGAGALFRRVDCTR